MSGILSLDKSARREGTSGTTPCLARHIAAPFYLPESSIRSDMSGSWPCHTRLSLLPTALRLSWVEDSD